LNLNSGDFKGFEKWRAMLKEALRQAGANNKDTVLLVGESSLSDERFLEDAHSVLSAGDVPGLFSAEERQEITETVMLDAQGGQRNVDLAPLQVRKKMNETKHVCEKKEINFLKI
jgi:dynein heavy chain, axonemal